MSESNEHQSDIEAQSTTAKHQYEAGFDLTDLGVDGYEALQHRLKSRGIEIRDLKSVQRSCPQGILRECKIHTVLSCCRTVRITFRHDPHDDADEESDYVGFVGISGTTREAVNTVVEAIVESATYVKDIDPDRAAYIRP